MVAGKVTVTSKSPGLDGDVECMSIRSARPSVTPKSVADTPARPQNTLKVVAVPGAEGSGVTLVDGRPEAYAEVAGAANTTTASMAAQIDAATKAGLANNIDSPGRKSPYRFSRGRLPQTAIR